SNLTDHVRVVRTNDVICVLLDSYDSLSDDRHKGFFQKSFQKVKKGQPRGCEFRKANKRQTTKLRRGRCEVLRSRRVSAANRDGRNPSRRYIRSIDLYS